MNIREFRLAGHWPTLLCAFLYFDISFMVWVLLGALANFIVGDFGLSDAQKGLLVAVPLLGGAALRARDHRHERVPRRAGALDHRLELARRVGRREFGRQMIVEPDRMYAARAQPSKKPVRLGFVPIGSPANAYDVSLVEALAQEACIAQIICGDTSAA